MLMLLNRNKRKFDDFHACLFICLLFSIFANGNEYAHKTDEYIVIGLLFLTVFIFGAS